MPEFSPDPTADLLGATTPSTAGGRGTRVHRVRPTAPQPSGTSGFAGRMTDTVLDGAIDLLLGGSCVGCARPGRLLCSACRAELPDAATPSWPTPVPPGLAEPWAAGVYEATLRAMVLGSQGAEAARAGGAALPAARSGGGVRAAPREARSCWCPSRPGPGRCGPAATTPPTRSPCGRGDTQERRVRRRDPRDCCGSGPAWSIRPVSTRAHERPTSPGRCKRVRPRSGELRRRHPARARGGL